MAEDPSINYEQEDFFFTVFTELGEEIELVKNGKNIKVTEKNKKDYVKRVARYYLMKQVSTESKEFIKGFLQVIPRNLISVFDADDLDFLICGAPEINVEDWKTNTQYRGDFNDKHKVVKWFWQIMQKLNQEELRKFLLFCTGMPRIPIEGFRALQSNRNKICKFQLQSVPFHDERVSYIKAHTCFNRLEVPLYKNKADLELNIRGILSQEKFFFDFE